MLALSRAGDAMVMRYTYWIIDIKALDDAQTQATLLYTYDQGEGTVVGRSFDELGTERVSPE